MKKTLLTLSSLLLATSAFAADLPRKSFPLAPVAVPVGMNWTGFYAGLHAGYAFKSEISTQYVNPILGTEKAGLSGFLYGLQLGYDYQFSRFVVGVAADYSMANISGSKQQALLPAWTSSAKIKSEYSLRLRAGYLISPALLVYATGGYANVNAKFSETNGFVTNSVSGNAGGYTVGLGAEYRFTRNLSAFGEYRMTNVSMKEPVYFGTVKAQQNDVRVGVNYRF